MPHEVGSELWTRKVDGVHKIEKRGPTELRREQGNVEVSQKTTEHQSAKPRRWPRPVLDLTVYIPKVPDSKEGRH